MNSHDESSTDVPADNAETEAFLRRISLFAMPMDRDRLVWDCGYEAGRAASGSATPAAGGGIRAWLPSLAATAAAFVVGFFSSSAFSVSPVARDARTEMATSAPSPTVTAPAEYLHPAVPAPRLKRPREELSTAVPLNRLDSFLAAPQTTLDPGSMAPPLGDPPLRVRNIRECLNQISL
jgi:hypothetical protein